jgi:thiosulfate/3-mercaptopyruvate sulfurtransferase
MSHHAGNERIVDAEWVADRTDAFRHEESEYRLLEVDMDASVYEEGHVPGAVPLDWEEDLAGDLGRDLVDKAEFEDLMGRLGVTPDTTVVVYGDKANWFAAHAYWVMSYYGHDDVRLMDGGRHHWLFENYETTTERPSVPSCTYEAETPDESVRVYREDVERALEDETAIVDVRNPKEFRGESPPADVPETTEREGHIPSAKNVPWGEAVNADGTFKPEDELREVYSDVLGTDEAVTYCRIGERSSLTWFVLHELLDVDAANYDGSWTEWGNSEDTPIERGTESESGGRTANLATDGGE